MDIEQLILWIYYFMKRWYFLCVFTDFCYVTNCTVWNTYHTLPFWIATVNTSVVHTSVYKGKDQMFFAGYYTCNRLVSGTGGSVIDELRPLWNDEYSRWWQGLDSYLSLCAVWCVKQGKLAVSLLRYLNPKYPVPPHHHHETQCSTILF